LTHNGRKYSFPNDERENDRLDLQHPLFSLTLDGKLFTAPIPKEKQLHCVLDVGTGTGIWAMDFADEQPETRVIGIDLSPTQPQFVPPNLTFEIDDLEETWTFNHPFDFIFARMTVGAFADSSRFFQQSLEHLSPGGWVECMDICNPVKSDDNSMPSDTALLKWSVSRLFNVLFIADQTGLIYCRRVY
jgi:cyclopropane fatty-acyl-phospholipid synthase-like methyltransferase